MNALLAEAIAVLKSLGSDGQIGRLDLPYAEVLDNPVEHLGPFRGLPSGLRTYLQRFYHEEEAAATLADGSLSHFLARAGALPSRTLCALERSLAHVESNPARSLRRPLRRLARQS